MDKPEALNVSSRVITVGHGSGGMLTSRLLDEVVFKLLGNTYLHERHDGAILQIKEPLAFSTDSYVVSPIFFPGGNIGDLAVNGTVNDLSMCGAIPAYLSLSFIIEEGLLIDMFEDIVRSIKDSCEKAGVIVVTGDTKVVERGKGDKIFINTSGIGSVMPKANIHIDNICEDSVVIVSNFIGNHGMAILSVREGLEFETQIVSDTAPLNNVVKTLIELYGSEIQLLRDPTRGGVATVLNELAEQSNLGIELEEESMPIMPEVHSACDMLGLDPLFVANEGNFIAVVSPNRVDEILNTLRQFECGIGASKIGVFSTKHRKKVSIKNAFGGERMITKLIGDQLPRIC